MVKGALLEMVSWISPLVKITVVRAPNSTILYISYSAVFNNKRMDPFHFNFRLPKSS